MRFEIGFVFPKPESVVFLHNPLSKLILRSFELFVNWLCHAEITAQTAKFSNLDGFALPGRLFRLINAGFSHILICSSCAMRISANAKSALKRDTKHDMHHTGFVGAEWRNGRRWGLKIPCPLGRVGSTPTSANPSLSEKAISWASVYSALGDCSQRLIVFARA